MFVNTYVKLRNNKRGMLTMRLIVAEDVIKAIKVLVLSSNWYFKHAITYM